jgi:hypothetical protein
MAQMNAGPPNARVAPVISRAPVVGPWKAIANSEPVKKPSTRFSRGLDAELAEIGVVAAGRLKAHLRTSLSPQRSAGSRAASTPPRGGRAVAVKVGSR